MIIYILFVRYSIILLISVTIYEQKVNYIRALGETGAFWATRLLDQLILRSKKKF